MNSIKFPWLLALAALIIGCQEERDLDFIDVKGEFVVVEARLTNEAKRHFVRLSQSSSYYDSKNVTLGIAGATVQINGIALNEITHPDSVGYYATAPNYQGLVGQVNTLEINIDGSIYSASSVMPPVPTLDSIFVFQNELQQQFGTIETGDTLFDIEVHYIEDFERKDRYAFEVEFDGQNITQSPNDQVFFPDDFLNGGPVFYVAQNFQTGDVRLDSMHVVTLIMRSLTLENLTFLEDFANQTEGSTNPFFAPPPANVSTNMSEGAVGFFEVSAVSKASTVFIPPGL